MGFFDRKITLDGCVELDVYMPPPPDQHGTKEVERVVDGRVETVRLPLTSWEAHQERSLREREEQAARKAAELAAREASLRRIMEYNRAQIEAFERARRVAEITESLEEPTDAR